MSLPQQLPVSPLRLATEISVTSRISGVGLSVPERVVPNTYFESYLDTSDEWIRERTGIRERRWVPAGTGVSELAEPAARQAIESAGLAVSDIDGIIFATVTGDYVLPSSACCLQRRLGAPTGFAFDVGAACSGFIYALTIANAMIVSGTARHVLVVGADIYSSTILDHTERSSAVLFGDGAGAVVVSAMDSASATNGARKSLPGATAVSGDIRTLRGLYGSLIHADGKLSSILKVEAGSAAPLTAETFSDHKYTLKMAGKEVFRHAVRGLVDVSEQILQKVGVTVEDVDFVVCHQANQRILDAVSKQLNIPSHKMLSNVASYGNTSAATIPILLAESVQQGVIKPGHLVMLSAFGAGVTWGAILFRF